MVRIASPKNKLRRCSICKKMLPADEFASKVQRCWSCDSLYQEWARGRKKTPEEIEKYGNVRVHLLVPTYKKVYSLYQFDWKKYAAIWKRIQKVALKYDTEIFTKTSPYRVLNLCYTLDENGKRQSLGDEKHIFRFKTLEKVRRLIAKELLGSYDLCRDVSVLKYLYKRTGIVLEVQKGQEGAEIAHIWDRPIRERLSINMDLLRGLRDRLEIEDATEKALKI